MWSGLEQGTVLRSEMSGTPYVAEQLLGEGGQGQVWRVRAGPGMPDERFALKWYFPHAATDEQHRALTRLVEGGAPDGRFLWPLELVICDTAPGFGYLMALRGEAPKNLRDVLAPGALVALPLGLVMLQPDLGTAQAFGGILFAVLFWAGTPIPLLILLASPIAGLVLSFDTRVWSIYIVVVLGALYLLRYRLFFYESAAVVLANFAAGTIARPLWSRLAAYQQNRLLVFLDPEVDPRGAGYHLIQSKIAIGSGGLMGRGFTAGTQKRFDFLPEQHTDFIFSVVGEELGFVGVIVALGLFAFVLLRLLRLAEESPDPFAGLVLLGIFGAWLIHIFVNVGMTVGLVPVTGIPLPFVSYGGSFLLMSWVALGVAVRVAHDEERPPG